MASDNPGLILDRPFGGLAPGSPEAKYAIAKVGIEVCGPHWRPFRKVYLQVEHTCLDCGGLTTRRSSIRCPKCAYAHRSVLARERRKGMQA
jgi:hypothetical protein